MRGHTLTAEFGRDSSDHAVKLKAQSSKLKGSTKRQGPNSTLKNLRPSPLGNACSLAFPLSFELYPWSFFPAPRHDLVR